MLSTNELAEMLLQSAPEHEGWSLVESPNSAGRYEVLQEWAAGMSMGTWQTDLTVSKPQLGLVLLWLESEVARRKGGDGTLWPILRDREIIPWNPWVYAELFNTTGQATENHKGLLRTAAKHYCLRHTFDEEDGRNWYRLIYLQFGFTHDDSVVRLAPWLSGQILPISVVRLLAASDAGGLAFQHMWRSLRMFRLGNLPKATLETRLRSNSWVLTDWCGDLIEAARRSRAQVLEVADLEAGEIKFFTAPTLCFTAQGDPYFAISLCNLREIGLESSEYQLKAGQQVLARLIRQPDGSYFSDAPENIPLPKQPTVALSLVGEGEKIAAYDEASLWDPLEEVTLYSCRTGQGIQLGERLRAGAEVFVIANGDVTFLPQPSESLNLVLGYCLHRIDAGWTGQIEALLDDDVVWSSSAQASATLGILASVSAEFTQTLDLRAPEWSQIQPPWNLPIRFRFSDGWSFSRLRWRRGDGHPVELEGIPTHLTLTESDAVRPVVLRVRITNGVQHRTEVLRVTVPFVAVLKWNEQGIPRRHVPEQNLLLGDARRLTWSFCLPIQDGQMRDAREFSFAEGTRLLGRLKSRPSMLPDLAGYGAPLQVLYDPYQADHAVIGVADCVLDGGVIGAVRWSADEGGFRIRSSFTDLGSDHRIYAWYSSGEDGSVVEQIPHEHLEQREDGWFWKGKEGRHLHAVALTFRGTRLGAWFDHASWSAAAVQTPPSSVEKTAAMLRAWKAPLLKNDGDHLKRMLEWVAEKWEAILPVWLAIASRRGPDGNEWVMPSRNASWCAAVGDLLNEALPMPDADAAGNLVERLAPNTTGINALGSAMWNLAEVCPILAARVVKIYLDEFVRAHDRNAFFAHLLPLPDFANTEERADELAKIHGNRDGYWLSHTVPTLAAINQTGRYAIPRSYRLLSKSKDYRYYALGRWLREIH